jgi:hypothetical protein
MRSLLLAALFSVFAVAMSPSLTLSPSGPKAAKGLAHRSSPPPPPRFSCKRCIQTLE